MLVRREVWTAAKAGVAETAARRRRRRRASSRPSCFRTIVFTRPRADADDGGRASVIRRGGRTISRRAGRLHYDLWSRPYTDNRTALFPGFTAMLLVLVALATGVAWRDARARMMLPIAVVGVLLSFGANYRALRLAAGARRRLPGHPRRGALGIFVADRGCRSWRASASASCSATREPTSGGQRCRDRLQSDWSRSKHFALR